MINVLGDALAAGIMAHLCKKDFDKAAAVAANSSAGSSVSKERVRFVSCNIMTSLDSCVDLNLKKKVKPQ